MRYLSLEWIEAVAAGVAASEAVSQAAGDLNVGITQVVDDAPEGTVTYHLQVADGAVSFGPGAADPESVRFQQDWEIAVDVATHRLNAQDAFIGGHIKLTGDQAALMAAQPVFAALDTVFAEVREHTVFPD
jgi:hypothetical protein